VVDWALAVYFEDQKGQSLELLGLVNDVGLWLVAEIAVRLWLLMECTNGFRRKVHVTFGYGARNNQMLFRRCAQLFKLLSFGSFAHALFGRVMLVGLHSHVAHTLSRSMAGLQILLMSQS